MDLTTLFLREPLPAHLRQLLRLCSANGKTHQLTVPERKPWSNAACDGSLSQGTLKCVLAPSFETNNNAWIDSNPAHRLTDGSRKAASRIHKMRREEVQGFAPLQHGVYFHTQTQTQIQKQQQNGSQCGLPRRRMRSLRWQTAPKAARRPRGQPHRRTAGTPHWSLLVSGASAAHPGPLLLMVLRSSSLPALSLSLSTEPGPHNWNFASSIWGKCTPPTTRAWCRLAAESTGPRTQKRRTATAVFDLCTDAPRTGMGNCVRE